MGSDYIGLVKQLDCRLCQVLTNIQETPTCAHHVRTGQGMAQRSGDFCVVALCQECHQGPLGIHGDQTLLRIAKVNEMDLLDMTIQGVFTRITGASPF